MRVGLGYDVHSLVKGRKLILGGVEIPHHMGLLGHSDADVLVHAVMDALLGSLALGDIGGHFPDSEIAYKNADSLDLLRKVLKSVKKAGFELVNVDTVIMAEKPKLAPHINLMRENLANCLDCRISQISIKATTTEKLGFVGREEGIAAQAIVMVDQLSA